MRKTSYSPKSQWMWENHDSCVETNIKLSETAALAVETKSALIVKWIIFKVDSIFLKRHLSTKKCLFCHLCTCDGEHRGLDSFCPVYQNCSAAKGDTQGFQVVLKATGQPCSVSDTSAEEGLYFEPFNESSQLK